MNEYVNGLGYDEARFLREVPKTYVSFDDMPLCQILLGKEYVEVRLNYSPTDDGRCECVIDTTDKGKAALIYHDAIAGMSRFTYIDAQDFVRALANRANLLAIEKPQTGGSE